MINKNISSPIFFGALLVGCAMLFGAGCSLFGSSTSTGPNGPDSGIWKTSDRGASWVNKRAMADGPKLSADMAKVVVQSITMDPQDRTAIYLGTNGDGLVYSWNSGDSWSHSLTLDAASITSVSVDAKNKCTVYATSGNKIFKTSDCMRDWSVAFFDPRTDKTFTQITGDWFSTNLVYAANNDGDIFKSADGGTSWQVAKRVAASITSLVVSPEDSRTIYAGTNGDWIWKSMDSGITWVQISKEFGQVDARRVIQIVPDPINAQRIYVVLSGGIAKTEDQGATWSNMTLISNVGQNPITALSVDPMNNHRLVYTGPTALVFSADSGATWQVKGLPTTSGGTALITDPKDGNIVYLGTAPRKK